MTKAPIGTTRVGILIFGVGGAALGAGADLGLIFDRPLAEPMLQGLFLILSYLARIPIAYRADYYEYYVIFIAAFASFWVALWLGAFIQQPARDRALDAYLNSRERIDHARRATTEADRDPPD